MGSKTRDFIATQQSLLLYILLITSKWQLKKLDECPKCKLNGLPKSVGRALYCHKGNSN